MTGNDIQGENMAGWRPLSRRGTESSLDEDALYEGVPAHLEQALLYWLTSLFERQEEQGRDRHESYVAAERRAGRIAARVRLDLRSAPQSEVRPKRTYLADWSASRALVLLAGKANDTVLLDVLDATLACGVGKEDAEELNRLLTDGGSAWHVTDDTTALQRRVSPTAMDALHTVSGTAAAHLKAAWAAAYGRHPTPSRAYSEAIKAVETSYIPVVLPRDRLATLGKVIGELNQHGAHWKLAISAPGGAPADISTLLGMLRLLWQGQTDRHGSGTQAIPVTASAAEAAVHLAVTLVQWCESGAVQPIGNP